MGAIDMKKRQMKIEEYENASGVCTIMISNARFQKNFSSCVQKVIKPFLKEGELFFGFYREDGVNLTFNRHKGLKSVIPAFFQAHGELRKLNEYLSVARIDSDVCHDQLLLSIFDYYLETVLFHPKVDWDAFLQYHADYLKHRYEDLILNHFADILFFYFDSGDLSVCFDPEIYDVQEIKNRITEVFAEM